MAKAANESDDYDVVPTSGICRPLSDILKELNKKVPDSLVKLRTEDNGFAVKYIPWSLSPLYTPAVNDLIVRIRLFFLLLNDEQP